jgi:hypothetical protein
LRNSVIWKEGRADYANSVRREASHACATLYSIDEGYSITNTEAFSSPSGARGRVLELWLGICCHTFRATGITAYLVYGGTIEKAQAIAAHESPRATNGGRRFMTVQRIRFHLMKSSGL